MKREILKNIICAVLLIASFYQIVPNSFFETEKNYIWTLYDKNNANEDDDQLRAVTGICFMFAILFILGLYSNLT